MDHTVASPARPRSGRYMAAMVLGTALSALVPSGSSAAPAPETMRAVSDISRYCTACWRNARLAPDAWGDCTQEVFTRLLERIEPTAWQRVLGVEGEERKEFLRAIDAVKKRTQRARKHTAPLPDALADWRDADNRQLADEREAVDQAAAELLTPRQQHVLRLSFEGRSASEIAAALDLPVERVSDEKYKAIRRLRERLTLADGRD